MTREEALKVWHNSASFDEVECSYELQEAISTAFRELEKAKLCVYPKEITFDDVQRYCKPRCLTIITNELLYQFIQDTSNVRVQNTVCKSHRIIGKHECCMADKGMPAVHCGGDKNKCEILDEED